MNSVVGIQGLNIGCHAATYACHTRWLYGSGGQAEWPGHTPLVWEIARNVNHWLVWSKFDCLQADIAGWGGIKQKTNWDNSPWVMGWCEFLSLTSSCSSNVIMNRPNKDTITLSYLFQKKFLVWLSFATRRLVPTSLCLMKILHQPLLCIVVLASAM